MALKKVKDVSKETAFVSKRPAKAQKSPSEVNRFGTEAGIEAQIKERTQELEQINASLYQEISYRQEVEEELKRSKENLQKQAHALAQLGRLKTTTSADFLPLLKKIIEIDAQALSVERVSVWLYNGDHSKIECVDLYEQSKNSHSSGLELQAEKFPAYFKALEADRVVAADDAQNDPRTSEFKDSYLIPLNITSMLDAPIHIGGKVIGVICHENVSDLRLWTIEDQNFASYMSDFVALHFEQRDRLLAEKALTRSQKLFASFMEHLPGAAWIKDSEGRYIYANKIGEKIFNTRLEDLLNKTDNELFDQETARQFKANDQIVLNNKKDLQTVEILPQEDGLHYSIVSKFPIFNDNTPPMVAGVAIDITERRKTEEAFIRSRKRYESLVKALAQVVWVTSADGEVVEDLPSWRELTGQSFEEMKGRGWLKALHPDDVQKTMDIWLLSLKNKTGHENEFRVLDKDGIYRHMYAKAVPIFQEDGSIREWIGTCTDITERKTNEDLLRQSEKQLRLVTDSLPVLISYVDTKHCYQFNNAAYEKWLGIPRDQIIGKHMKDILGEKAYEATKPYVEEVLQGKLVNYESELPYQNGKRYVNVTYVPNFSSKREILGFYVLVTDTTTKFKADQRLKIQYGVNRILAESSLLAEASTKILETICQMAGWEYGAIWYFDRETNKLRVGEIWHIPEIDPKEFKTASKDMQLAPGIGLPGRVLASRNPVWMDDVTKDDNFPRADMAIKAGFKGGIGFPIQLGHEALGVIEFFHREIRQPDREFIDLMTAIGHKMGQYIQRRKAENEVKRLNHNLQLRVQELQTILDVLPIGMGIAYDPECRTIIPNQEMLKMLGLTKPQNISQASVEISQRPSFRILKNGQEIPSAELPMQKAAATKQSVPPMECDFVHPDGKVVHVLTNASPLFDESGNVRGAVGATIDITERKKAEEKIKQYTQELIKSNRELEEFAYVASHDLQEPLRVISGYVQLLNKRYTGKLDDTADEFIKYIVQGIQRMQRLIKDLLMYSRLQEKRSPIKETDMKQVYEQALENLKLSIEENKAIIICDPLPVVQGNQIQLVQLMQNLIGNAIKFHKPEANPEIRIACQSNETEFEFSVKDNGIGIEQQYFDRIFEIFRRLQSHSEYEGTGIGLAVCKKILDNHGGRIWVDSQPGVGTTFFFTLPKKRNENPS